jgi:hypothetical protein
VWQDGWAFGPRYLTDISPLLALFLAPAWKAARSNTFAKTSFLTCAAASIAIHSMGVFLPNAWRPDLGSDIDRLWDWSDGQLVHSSRQFVYKITGQLRPLEYPSAGLNTDKITCRAGEDIEFTVTLIPGTYRDPIDVYLLVSMPDGRLHYLTQKSAVIIPEPLLKSHPITERESIRIDYPCKGDLPSGTYNAGVNFVQAGGAADFNPLALGLIYASQGVNFQILRP